MKRFLVACATAFTLSLSAYESPIIEGYWESWNSTDSVETIVSMHSNVINISFGTFTSLGDHTFQVSGVDASDETINHLVELAHEQGKKVKLSVGGATYDLSALLRSEEDAEGMADAMHAYVTQFNLDGVDFDIEDYPAAELQSDLISYTRERLGSDALITYTPKAPASTTLPYSEVIKESYADLDGINIMAYDAWSGYSYQDDSLALVGMGVPKDIIVIGLMPGMDDVGHETTLQDVQSAANWVKSQGLGGIMFWSLNRDHENQTGLGVDAATNAVWRIFDSAVQPRG